MTGLNYGGYRANLVTYTLARLSHDTKGRIDLGRVWREQALTPALEGAIQAYSRHVWEHITHPPGAGNVTQYCKQFGCWESFLERDIPFPKALTPELRDAGSGPILPLVKDRRPETVRKVMELSSEQWFALADWGKKNDTLNGLQLEIVCKIASDIGYSREVSLHQAKLGWGLLSDARKQAIGAEENRGGSKMANIKKMTPLTLDREAPHRDVDCTYSIVTDANGQKCLQIDTYGSAQREIPDKKSQSLRFTPEAIQQLKAILADLF